MNKLFKAVFIALIFSAVVFTGCKKNKAPDKPSIPSGPTGGSKNTQYTFTSTAEDPNDDSVAIRFDWGDGDTSYWSDFVPSGDSISRSHTWSDTGSYTIKAQAEDLKEAVSSWSGSRQITIGPPMPNDPPNTPITPIGDSIGSTNVSHSFVSTANDPDGDSIAIRFNWGDGDTSNWSDFVPSGDSVSMSHSWSDTGTYNIKAQAKDKKDTTSGWSVVHSIKISGGGWFKTFGDSSYDFGYAVDVTMDGGYIIAGWTRSYGAGESDVYLIKTDANGNQQWYKTFGGSNYDNGYSVQQTADGGYIITGETYSYGAGQLADVFLVKTDSSGTETWHKVFGDSNDMDLGWEVQQTTDGGYIIGGWTGSDVYLIKTDASGTERWHKIYGGSSGDGCYSVQPTSEGGYVIAAYTRSYGAGSADAWLIKTDADGDTMWTKTFGGSNDDFARSVRQTMDGGYVITGSTLSYGAGELDVYLIKTDASGTAIWTKTFGGSDDDVGYSVQLTTDGGYIITGTTGSLPNQDVYLVKTDASGNKLWEKTFGGSSNDEGHSIQRHYDSFIITGSTGALPNYDVLLIKTDANGNVK